MVELVTGVHVNPVYFNNNNHAENKIKMLQNYSIFNLFYERYMLVSQEF